MEALISIVGSIVGSLAGKAAEYTVDPIARQLSYLFKHESKFQNLRGQVQVLKDEKERMQQSVHEATRNGEEIYDYVQRWLCEVEVSISGRTIMRSKEDEEKAKKRCLVGLCPNFRSRYQLSKKADEEINAIAKLLKEKDRFHGVSYCSAPSTTTILECMGPVKSYEAFESRKDALNGVMEALEDDNLYIIGVYGMGGVGKTTLVKEVAKKANEKRMFERVVFIAITQTPNKLYIQNEIADKLGLRLDETSMDVRAARLYDRLMKEKKVLIILDDIWVTMHFQELGIPSRGEHHGCKILMTSRKLEILKSMDSQENFSIDTLKEDEAWILFRTLAGSIVERHDLQSTAIEISRKCTGLPLAIATVARALKHKENLYEWQDALEQLKRPSEGDNVYSAIKLSYNFLKDKEVQLTFLLCSLMGHYADIEDLLKFVRGLGLFRGLNTIQNVRNRVSTLVSDLKDSSLLQATYFSDRFDMHDVVRDVAISIASRNHQWLALGREDIFEEWLDEETMRNCNLLSIRYAKVSQLPDDLECPNLTFFSMDSKDCSLEIPDNFFKGMQRLKVLKFSNMHFSSLSPSICVLKNIHTLLFFSCKLNDITIIGELKSLEILSLRGSQIVMLPTKFEQLMKLKLLDLSDCYDLKVISPGVLSNLTRLEELYMYGSFDRWEEVVEGNDHDVRSRSNASLVELQHLPYLTTLEVHIAKEQAIPKDNLFFLEKLERCKIFIGKTWEGWYCHLEKSHLETSNILKVQMDDSSHLFDGAKPSFLANLFLLQNLTILEVAGCHNLKYVFVSSMVNSFVQLQRLVIKSCDRMEEVVVEDERRRTRMVFPKLDYLHLWNLPNLKRFCSANIPVEFPFLKELIMWWCPVLNTFHCDSTSNGSEARTRCISIDHSLHNDIPQSLFNEKVAFPMLEKLNICSMANLERIWANQLAERSFSKLICFELLECPKLVNVFPLSMMTRLDGLENLRIQYCELVEEIFEYSQDGSTKILEFPRLMRLVLEGLPKLKMSLCPKSHTINWPSLKEMYVRGIKEVEILFACQETTRKSQYELPVQLQLFRVNKFTFPSLQKVSFGYNDGMKEIWHGNGQQLASDYFCNLRDIQLHGMSYLNKLDIFPSEYIQFILSLPNLEKLQIGWASFREIFQSEELVVGCVEKPASTWVVHCSQLTELRLICLSKLMHLWKEKIGFPNLRTLHVEFCPKLKDILVSSSVTFHNLVTLEVIDCDGITKLVTHSTAKSLVQLKEMKIENCKTIEKVIGGDDDDDDDDDTKDEICFPKLEYLKLERLPKLRSFCSSGNYTFGFISLKMVVIQGCPIMNMFSQGESRTPKLHKQMVLGELETQSC